MHTKEFTVTGMTCDNCEAHVREEVEGVAGLTAVEVNRAAGTLRVSSEGAIDEAAVIAAVDEAGYTATAA